MTHGRQAIFGRRNFKATESPRDPIALANLVESSRRGTKSERMVHARNQIIT